MLFNSFSFAFFFPIVAIFYFFLSQNSRIAFLLISSCLFYMCLIPQYILILFLTILVDYLAGIMIESSPIKRVKKAWLILSILITCLILFYFKYYNFFIDNINFLNLKLGLKQWSTLNLILPIGLSFHTFQSLSYVIEVYNGRQSAERNFLIYSLYVMYFPQLVAGPIERPQHILPQLKIKHSFNYDRAVSGIILIIWGLLKKVVIADRLAVIVDYIYQSPQGWRGPIFIITIVFFAFQIYCDFSGYTDIARGCSRILGIELMKNFNNPYNSTSVKEFWRRWHISLSTWFRDYVYIPLGGSGHSVSLLITFIISGVWHGANWTYIFWGLINGLFVLYSREKEAGRFPVLIKKISTFALICFAWIFFRARNLTDLLYILTHLHRGWSTLFKGFIEQGYHFIFSESLLGQDLTVTTTSLTITILYLTLVLYIELKGEIERIIINLGRVRWLFYYFLVISIVLFGEFGTNKFIYFQF